MTSVEYMFCKVWFYKWLCECFYVFSISVSKDLHVWPMKNLGCCLVCRGDWTVGRSDGSDFACSCLRPAHPRARRRVSRSTGTSWSWGAASTTGPSRSSATPASQCSWWRPAWRRANSAPCTTLYTLSCNTIKLPTSLHALLASLPPISTKIVK